MEENTFPKKVQLGMSVLLLISGVALYLAWALWYNAWNFFDPLYIGLYSLVSVMVLFGILGVLLTRAQTRAQKTK
jgi:hypothetical protein